MSQIRLDENIVAPSTPSSGKSIIYPKADGLWYSKDDAGVEKALASVGGSNTQVQFNDSGILGGDAGLTYNKTTDTLVVGGNITGGGLLSFTGLGTHVLGPNASSVGSTATSLIISGQNSGNAGFSLRQGLTEKASFTAASDGNTYLDYQGIFNWRESSGFINRMNLSAAGNLTISNASGTGLTVGSGATITAGNLLVSSGTITSGAPAGGTAGAWKLGVAAVVTPTLPNRTIEVDIGGTIFFIHAKTTND